MTVVVLKLSAVGLTRPVWLALTDDSDSAALVARTDPFWTLTPSDLLDPLPCDELGGWCFAILERRVIPWSPNGNAVEARA